MRGATQCAKRLKSLFSALRAKLGKVAPPPSGDPVTQMLLGILSRDVPESKAREALDRIRQSVVDYNELRVIPPLELAEMLGDYPDVRLKSEDISRALNSVFAKYHAVTLDHFKDLPKKELLDKLERIEGLEAYTRARIRLLGLQQHAIPLDEAMWAYARREEIVDGRCPLQEAQAFLERQIPPEEALEFVALLKRQAWTEMATAVRRGEVERILSIPPDRTTQNMLQAVGAAARGEAAEEPAEAAVDSETGDGAQRSKAKKTSGGKKPTSKKTKAKPASSAKPSAGKTQAKSARTKTSRARSKKTPSKKKARTTSAKKARSSVKKGAKKKARAKSA